MTSPWSSVHRLMGLLCVLGVAASVTGCGRTLVFLERDGVNFAVRANASSTPPIEVNFGLNRVIATVVPPAGESGNTPSGEAVNLFAGFQVDRPRSPNLAKPVAADLTISTQFASGKAAKKVAESPPIVVAIVNPDAITIPRTSDFVTTFHSRQQIVTEIGLLTDQQVVAVAASMLQKVSTRPELLQQALAPQIARLPADGTIPPAMARSILNRWASMETVTPDTSAEWAAAFTLAKQ